MVFASLNSSTANCAVIIVTHNSQRYLAKCMQALGLQTLQPAQIIIIDSASTEIDYLQPYTTQANVELACESENIGYCRGNNLGWAKVRSDLEYVLLLNPDVFLPPPFIEEAIATLQNPKQRPYGALTGKMLGYDINIECPSKRYDSTGIFQHWWGGWYDRGQGKSICHTLYLKIEEIPAICGALYFLRKAAADSISTEAAPLFDESFYMYKEDIDLSLRLRKQGWKLLYVPHLWAYHCRGWSHERRRMPKAARLRSARNEVKLQFSYYHPVGMLYSCLKWLAVRYGNW